MGGWVIFMEKWNASGVEVFYLVDEQGLGEGESGGNGRKGRFDDALGL